MQFNLRIPSKISGTKMSIFSGKISIIESTWPENLLAIQSRVFPNDLSHAKAPSNCNGIVKTIQTAVDRANGLLWLLDNGSKYCTPKLIVFDLLRGNNFAIPTTFFTIISTFFMFLGNNEVNGIRNINVLF